MKMQDMNGMILQKTVLYERESIMQHHFHFHLHHHARHHARYDVDMTQGSTTRHLVRFALPLLAGNLFQQLYNMVDTWVVGNFVSNEAFSAVGTVTPIINTLIGFFLGMSSGAGVVISQYYGAHRPEKVREAVHTAMLLTVIMGVVFTGVGIAMTPLMLELMKTPAEVAPDQAAYLTIYFAGIMGLLLYNMGSGILRAVGDSQRPFYFLLVSAGVNTALDLLFVLKFGMGVEGVAYATIIAQAVSAVLTIAVLIGYDGSVKLSLRDLRIHWRMLKKIVAVGIPAALQMAITAFSNVFVQGYINHFGADCMSGWTAYTKIDQLVILPVQSLSLASTTFVGQNLGVGNVLLRLLSPFYFFFCINQIYSGALRGSGNSQVPMFIMLGSFVVFRQIYLYVMAHFISNEIVPIAMGYPAGWFVCSAVTLLYYAHCKFDSHRLVEDV